MSDWYILKGRTPVPATAEEWSAWRTDEGKERIVARSDVGGRWVSTVFLGLDHAYGNEPPMLFETMVFPSRDDLSELYCTRCSTYDAAEAMHEKACQWVRDGEPERY